MTTCSKFEALGVLYLYEELAEVECRAYEAHLKSCSTCRIQLDDMRQTLAFMDRRDAPKVKDAYWDHFGEALEERMRKESGRKRTKPKLYWLAHTLAAAALLTVGILLGKFWATPQVIDAEPAKATQGMEIHYYQQANEYVSRSKTLLIGLVNMDADDENHLPVDFSLQQKASRELMNEAAVLRANYPKQADVGFLELMDALEMIFLQIAHLDANSSVEGLEIIQEGVARGDLLLKINLEQLVPSLPQPEKTTETIL